MHAGLDHAVPVDVASAHEECAEHVDLGLDLVAAWRSELAVLRRLPGVWLHYVVTDVVYCVAGCAWPCGSGRVS